MSRPTLFVTNLVAPDRAGAFAALHERTPIELALFGGRSHHATGEAGDPGVPFRRVDQRAIARLAASGRYDAVVCGTAGRVALPAAYAGARAARTPFVLWTAMWAELRTPAHLAARPLLRQIHRDADAVVTYGPHVTAFARRLGARNVHEAPQAVDHDFWRPAPPDVERASARGRPTFAFVGREAPEKGLAVLLEAWRAASADLASAELLLVGVEREPGGAAHAPITAVGPQEPDAVRNFLRSASVLVVPSIPTPSFLEPWGLVANEAMHLGLPVIATDAVGAAAGGLVRHERNGLVVAAGDAGQLAAAIRRLRDDDDLRMRLGAAARRDAAAYTQTAWAAGFAGALRSIHPLKEC